MSVTLPFQRLAQQMAGVSVQLILPAVCRLCDEPIREGDDFCAACETGLTLSGPMMRSACPRCGVPRPLIIGNRSAVTDETSVRDETSVTEETSVTSERGATSTARSLTVDDAEARQPRLSTCQQCSDEAFGFSRVVTLWTYQGLVCDAIVAAKYVYQCPLADALGRRLGDAVADQLVDDFPAIVTFVPSHFSRQITRGGNGNRAIAEAVAKRLSLGSQTVRCRQLLRTTRRIAKQAWLDDEARTQNVQGAFAVKKGYALTSVPRLNNQHILLVDDVLTTGATASEVSRMLYTAGASRVTLAVVARSIRAN